MSSFLDDGIGVLIVVYAVTLVILGLTGFITVLFDRRGNKTPPSHHA